MQVEKLSYIVYYKLKSHGNNFFWAIGSESNIYGYDSKAFIALLIKMRLGVMYYSV